MPRTTLIAIVFLQACLAMAQFATAQDGLRKIDVGKYGIVVHVPQAWTLVDWAQNERAFVLKLPQDQGSPVGLVTCELSVASTSLEQFQQHDQAAAQRQDVSQPETHPQRKLLENRIEPLDPARYGNEAARQIGRRLTTTWQHEAEGNGPVWYEARVRLVSHRTLYTFTLTSDEAHYESYRLDFEEMLSSARFSPPETGLQGLPGGFWMQREFRFALRLPDGWQPAFTPHDKVLLFATGQQHEAFTDNLLVLASPAAPLDLAQLKRQYAGDIAKADPRANVESCEIVPQAAGAALETVIQTQRGPYSISILERRFRGEKRNYDVKFTCESAAFKKLLPDLRKSLDSFRELQDAPEKTIL